MAIVIKEIKVRTIVEKQIVSETEMTEEMLRRLESRLLEKLNIAADSSSVQKRRRRER